MRIVSIISAALVCVSLYLFVMEREALFAFASGEAAVDAPAATAVDTQASIVDRADQTERAVPVVARVSRAQTVENAVLLRGQTEAAREVEVRAEVSAKVISEPIQRGTTVAAGDVLCRLDPGTRLASLAEAEARLADATLTARNAERLSEGGFAAETRAVSARAALQAAEAGLEAAKREISRLEIRAPFGGILEANSAEMGALLQPGGLCATVMQLDPVRLVGFVPETDVARIEVGAMAGGRLASGREAVGRVTFLARSADTQTRTFRAEVSVPNPDLEIRDGQTVEMLIATEGVKAHLLPGSALTLDDGGRLGVRLADADNRAKFVEVRVLRDTVEGMWVTGLPDSANVIILGQEYVVDGVLLAVTLQEAGE